MTTVTDTLPPASAPAGRPWPGDDFADWLPPMLVRELRQGLNSGAFFWTFLLMQLLLALHAAFTTLAVSGEDGGSMLGASNGFFWAIIVIVVGVVLPFRGLNAIAHERVGNNLDLVRLTRLSALRIVVGKWAAVVAQVLLVTAAILPYLVLRYFLGGVNVVGDLARLRWVVVSAAVVAAVAVYFSTRPQRERIALVVLSIFGGWGMLIGSVSGALLVGGVSPGWGGIGIAAVYVMLFLEAAAASIAPASENHAFWQRLGGLGCAAVIAVAGVFGSPAEFRRVFVPLGLPVLFLFVGALCERPVRFRRMHAAFARGGIAGRAAAAVLTPGWATGLVFTALAGGLTAVGYLATMPDATFAGACVALTAAAVVFPLPLLLFLPKLKERATLYAVAQVICLVALGCDAFVRGMPGSTRDTPALVVPFPLAGLLRLVTDGRPPVAALLLAGLVVLAVILVIVARPWCREMRETQRLVGERAAA